MRSRPAARKPFGGPFVFVFVFVFVFIFVIVFVFDILNSDLEGTDYRLRSQPDTRKPFSVPFKSFRVSDHQNISLMEQSTCPQSVLIRSTEWDEDQTLKSHLADHWSRITQQHLHKSEDNQPKIALARGKNHSCLR